MPVRISLAMFRNSDISLAMFRNSDIDVKMQQIKKVELFSDSIASENVQEHAAKKWQRFFA